MSKNNTLFKYFKKESQSVKCSTTVSDIPANKPTCDTSLTKANPKSNLTRPNQVDDTNNNNHTKSEIEYKTSQDEQSFSVGDLVWAKLEGYPWWPSLICNHPNTNKHYKYDKSLFFHVQFFDDPVSRSWIKLKMIKKFNGEKEFSRGSPYFSTHPHLWEGVQQADKALSLSLDDRLALIVELQPSDEEDEEVSIIENEVKTSENMEWDSDLFDCENSDSENKNSNPTVCETSNEHIKHVRSAAKRRKIIIESGSDEDENDEFKPDDELDESSYEYVSDEVIPTDSDEDLKEEDSPQEKKSVKSTKRKRKQPLQQSDVLNKLVPSKGSTPISDSKRNDSVKRKSPSASDSHDRSNKQFSIFTPKSEKKVTGQLSSPKFNPSIGSQTKNKLATFSPSSSNSTSVETHKYPHLSYSFLQPDKICDANRKRPNDIDYNPRTLYVDHQFLQSQTPAQRQWWVLKSSNFDTILFFKMGKFYELFHMDSVIAVKELGLVFMKGDLAHCGFPEVAYPRYAETLISKGYKIARIEQTETPDIMEERVKKLSKVTKFDKVVNREICTITTKGTRKFSFIDGDSSSSQNAYLLALCEIEHSNFSSSFGVCFVDTSIGKIHLGQFVDDRFASKLQMLISHHSPSHVLYERGKISVRTQNILNNLLTSAIKESIRPNIEFWQASKTLKEIADKEYFSVDGSASTWPDALKKMISDADTLCQNVFEEYELCVRSLGAVVWHLQTCYLDHEILSLKQFVEYSPLQAAESSVKTSVQPHMILDSVTLSNLEILENQSGSQKGSLFARLDQCSTAFGRRLLKQWICNPLANPDGINDRLDAMSDLMHEPSTVDDVVLLLKQFPDLPRLLSRIHTLGSSHRSKNHPDSRAIFFDEVVYSKRKIADFLSALSSFKTAMKIMEKFKPVSTNFKSKILLSATSIKNEDRPYGKFPNLDDKLIFFDEAFDHQKAKAEGSIKPNKGVNPEYDESLADIHNINSLLNEYLDKQKPILKCKPVYWGNGKNRFQIEVPETSVNRVPDHYMLESSKKGYKRYRTQEVNSLFDQLVEAENRKDAALKDTMRKIFNQFDHHYEAWDSAVQCLSVIDVLISLSKFCQSGDGEMCRPNFTHLYDSSAEKPFVEIRQGRHPCIVNTFSGGDFIPNDTVIGKDDDNNSSVVLVTGPNMGGKSTLMRQVGILCIIAQLGCYVPAEEFNLTPIDRIFTRLGASDRIMAGESTFFVELSETSSILQNATVHSLVLMDELGRGTATYDGTAIAESVVNEMSKINCRTLFSTHYHSLVDQFRNNPNIRTGHMDCMIEKDPEDPDLENITFLYTFTAGNCPKSFGFNAARLADIPNQIIKNAKQKAKEIEIHCNRLDSFKLINKENIVSHSQLTTILKKLAVN